MGSAYDARWLKTRYPGASEDFDGSYFQHSLPDQWRDDFFAGNEAFSVVNMHPEKEFLEGKLPSVVGCAFVKRKGEEMVRIPMRIDTLHLYPHRERQVVVCRATTSTKSDSLADIEEAGFALEWIGKPKSDAHYIEEFAWRRKRGTGLKKLDESGLLPEGNPPPRAKERFVAPGEGLRQRRVERRLQTELDRVRQVMVENELDTSELDKFPTHFDLSVSADDAPAGGDIPTVDDIKKRVAEKTDEAIAKVRGEIEKVDGKAKDDALTQLDATAEKLKKGPVGPPVFSRQKTREHLEDQVTLLKNVGVDPSPIQTQLDDPALDQRMRELEAFVRESYRKKVQHQGVAPVLDADLSGSIRERVLRMVKDGESFDGVDLTGADLSKLDLRGAKMTRAFMESVDLTGTNLEGAELDLAVLARAKLTGANFTKVAKIAGANLSETSLAGADFSGLDLTGCYFVGADLTETKFANTTLDRVDFARAMLKNTDMSGSKATRPKFHKMRFENVSIRGSQWDRPLFYESVVIGLDAKGATLPNCSFVDTTVEGCIFDDAKLLKLRAARALAKTTMPKCSFARATIHKGMFRGIDMQACDFHHADLKESDFLGSQPRRLQLPRRAGGRGALHGREHPPVPLRSRRPLRGPPRQRNDGPGFVRGRQPLPRRLRPLGRRRRQDGRRKREMGAHRAEARGAIGMTTREEVATMLEQGATFQGTVLDGLDLHGLDFGGSQFIDASLRQTKLHGARMSEVTFSGSNLGGADFTGATLKRSTFYKCEAPAARFDKADLSRGKFVESTPSGGKPEAPI